VAIVGVGGGGLAAARVREFVGVGDRGDVSGSRRRRALRSGQGIRRASPSARPDPVSARPRAS
jgi:hypothetical protein